MAFADFLCLEEIIPADKSSIGSSAKAKAREPLFSNFFP